MNKPQPTPKIDVILVAEKVFQQKGANHHIKFADDGRTHGTGTALGAQGQTLYSYRWKQIPVAPGVEIEPIEHA